jgi:TrmH family RNA methyltransferase
MSNSNVKFIKGLNEKKFRVKNNAFYLEGIKVVNEILDKKKAIDILFIAYSKVLLCNANGGKEMIDRLEALKGIKVIEIEENPFRYMTDTISPQGVVVVLKMPDYDFDNEIKNCKSNIVILDKIQDLGNLGTIIRSCNAFDIDLIICTKETADVYSPKTLRSTMGGIINTKVLYVDNLEQLKKLKEYGYNIVTTSLNTDSKLCDLKIDEKYAFVMGNEANGVSKEIMNFSDMLVKIPMSDKIESLNVGVAASIILYEQYKNKTSRK